MLLFWAGVILRSGSVRLAAALRLVQHFLPHDDGFGVQGAP